MNLSFLPLPHLLKLYLSLSPKGKETIILSHKKVPSISKEGGKERILGKQSSLLVNDFLANQNGS